MQVKERKQHMKHDFSPHVSGKDGYALYQRCMLSFCGVELFLESIYAIGAFCI